MEGAFPPFERRMTMLFLGLIVGGILGFIIGESKAKVKLQREILEFLDDLESQLKK